MISSPDFDVLRNWIRNARRSGWSWDEIRMIKKPDVQSLEAELQRRIAEEFWHHETTSALWFEIVNSMETAEKERKELEHRKDDAMLTDKLEDNGVKVPDGKYSSWVQYKQYLQQSGWRDESIAEMEDSTVKILRRLSTNTRDTRPIKGLVVGHVQSGKTANMAALMAMAADWGWNMFIVLSGTIENLRKQTQSRLFYDLNRPGNIAWRQLEHMSFNSPIGQRAQDLIFDEKNRFFTVCLKHPKRLEDLLKWLHADAKSYEQMRIIVIDDESDHGGINTAKLSKDEQIARSRINRLIVNLVENKRYDNEPAAGKPEAMNYIGYTATPYANVLNESDEESLYPRNFIRTLQPSAEYFGAKQIFGIDGTEQCDGLDIIREVTPIDLHAADELHKGTSMNLPVSATEAVAWFLCAASAMRLEGYKKPISMLVHTSHKQVHHDNVAQAISALFSSDKRRERLLKICRAVWEREVNQFSLEAFKNQFPDYPYRDSIRDYPQFEQIEPGINRLMSEISHIPLNEDKAMKYHDGIHLCIDNCANNGINDENMVVRLTYPDHHQSNYPSPAPAFIVVGGSTLSRGLTIEGLVSTFFLRSASQADSLMQMGRWFGYRRGYELYPRIWMTEKTRNQFKFLALLEHELRDDLRRFMVFGADPTEYGPRVLNSAGTVSLRITAANKMKNAIPAEMDFSGINVQTVVFPNDTVTLKHNIDVAEAFLQKLGPGKKSLTGESIVWRDVPFQLIKEGLLLGKYAFHERATGFSQMEAFCKWFEETQSEAGYTNWNIVVGGNRPKWDDPNSIWRIPGGEVGKITRSKQNKSARDGSISIGVLRAPKDLYEDIDIRTDEIESNRGSADNNTIRETRLLAGLEKTPLLILYRIDKSSKAPENSKTRVNLDAPEDIIGISIWVPGVKSKSLVKTLTIKIDKQIEEAIDETGDLVEN